ncbi:hypothetical protein BJX76DRAFT_336950 [Aspergillus varians]
MRGAVVLSVASALARFTPKPGLEKSNRYHLLCCPDTNFVELGPIIVNVGQTGSVAPPLVGPTLKPTVCPVWTTFGRSKSTGTMRWPNSWTTVGTTHLASGSCSRKRTAG